MRLTTILFFIIIGCTDDKIQFKFDNLIQSDNKLNHYDSLNIFIVKALNKDFNNCERLFPTITNLDVSLHIVKIDGQAPYLNSLGTFLQPFIKSPIDLLGATVFLRMKFNTKIDLYDKMLRGVIRLDNENIQALYLLAELRYNQSRLQDSKFLISKAITIAPNNKELKRIKELLKVKPETDVKLYESIMGFTEKDVYYIEQMHAR